MSVYTNQSGFAASLFLTEQGTGIGIAKGIYARPPAGGMPIGSGRLVTGGRMPVRSDGDSRPESEGAG